MMAVSASDLERTQIPKVKISTPGLSQRRECV